MKYFSYVFLVTLASGCASTYLRRAPSSPREPWPLGTEAVRRTVAPSGAAPIAPDHLCTLPELIDLAESNNPDTRIGWQKARQAALAVGIPMAGYFPTVEALTLVGYQHTIFPAPNLSNATIGVNPFQVLPNISFKAPALPSGSVGVDTFQVLPFVLVTQEVLNVARIAEVHAAEHTSTAANAAFTAEHEKVIFEVARAYFRLNAARTQVAVSRDSLERTRAIAKAAEARFDRGVATSVELSEAKREVAQAELAVAQAEALEIAADASLIAAVGVEPRLHLGIARSESGPLPSRLERTIDSYVEEALTARADLRAARAKLPASEAHVSQTLATFIPKIKVFGTAGGAIFGAHIDGTDLPTLSIPAFTTGVNFEWLIFDGGLREVQAETARSQRDEAREQLRKLELQVVQEVVTAYHEANASLSRYRAAIALYDTAATAESATTKSYLNGLATLTEAMNAQKARATAQAAREQAFADALVARTTLAFAVGQLISAKAVPDAR
jgi:outer membrane protein TolC